VGRTVSGLPMDQSQFAIAPPFFTQQSSILDQAIEENFTFLPLNMWKIAEFLIASLVDHSEWLQENLPSSHRLFRTMLFEQAETLQDLKELVVCRIPTVNDPTRTTRIPPFIRLIYKWTLLQRKWMT
jgi:hypothetical protein